MKPVTLDQIGIEIHERYARDQQVLDKAFVEEAAPHSEVMATSSIFASEWDKLFSYSTRNVPWASFVFPPFSFLSKKRSVFVSSVLPSLEEDEQQDHQKGESDEEHEDENKRSLFAEIRARLLCVQAADLSKDQLERERSILLRLLESVEELNELLKEIQSRKLQYQKG